MQNLLQSPQQYRTSPFPQTIYRLTWTHSRIKPRNKLRLECELMLFLRTTRKWLGLSPWFGQGIGWVLIHDSALLFLFIQLNSLKFEDKFQSVLTWGGPSKRITLLPSITVLFIAFSGPDIPATILIKPSDRFHLHSTWTDYQNFELKQNL